MTRGSIYLPGDRGIGKGIYRPGPNKIGGSSNILGKPSGPRINLSAATVADTATVGAVIGTLSVSSGIGSYTYTFTSNPGTLFSITTNQLKVAAALSAGSDPISIQANNGAGSVITQPFLITVTHAGTFAPTFELLGF